MNKQIEEKTCKDCLHYEVCMYVNAKAVEFARAENCKLFTDTKDYRKIPTNDWLIKGVSEEQLAKEKAEVVVGTLAKLKCNVAREIFEEIEGKIAENDDMFERCASRLVSSDYANGRSEVVGEILHFLAELKKKYESEGAE